jgi:hypothetical protein
MTCHECARERLTAATIGQCRFCFDGLCKDHLVASFRGMTIPQYGCEHHPERAFEAHPREVGRPAPAHAAA